MNIFLKFVSFRQARSSNSHNRIAHLPRTALMGASCLLAFRANAQSVYTTPYTITTYVSQTAGRTDSDGLSVGSPTGVALDAQGNLYVSNPDYSTIRKVTPDGVPAPVAGTVFKNGSADGTATDALFDQPHGIALDQSGNIYVADTGNFTIRKITPAGVVTTLAGMAGVKGSADGTGTAARFNAPFGLAIDSKGNLFVSEEPNDLIRKITPDGVVTTVAGVVGAKGSLDGTGSAARFDNPGLIAIDAEDNVIIPDTVNDEIRKMTPGGIVTTIAGAPEIVGSTDGTGAAARFYLPAGVAVDAAGNIFVTDQGNFTVRRITPTGVVTTVAGSPNSRALPGGNDGVGSAAAFNSPFGIAVDGSDSLFISDQANDVLLKGTIEGVPQIVTQPMGQFVMPGSGAAFAVSASGSASISYQWNFNGTPIPGANGATFSISNAAPSAAGAYTVTVTDALGSITSKAATLVVGSAAPTTRLVNISTRAQVGTGADILIPGFVIGGTGAETLLIRADGPALAAFNVPGVLAQPSLAVFDAKGALLASNTGWGTSPDAAQIAVVSAQVNAFALTPGSADCALLVTLPAGSYTVHISGVNNTTGVALAEVYEVASTGTRLVNISTRALVGTGANVVIPGFVVSGSGSEQLLVRADGPSLAQFNVAGVLALPALSLYDASQAIIASNVGWFSAAEPSLTASVAAAVNAYMLYPSQADSALVATLVPGAYTMQVSGAGGTTGVALAEVYEVP